jgi:predicted PurR-regulated permease PerM
MNRSLDTIILRYVGYGLMALAGLFLLYQVRGTLPIFLLALLLAYAMEPMLQRFERRGRSRATAVSYVFLCFLLLLTVAISLLASAWQQAQSLAVNIPAYERQAVQLTENVQQRIDDARLPKDVKKSAQEAFTDFRQRAPQLVAERLQNFLAFLLGSVGSIALLFVVLPLITFWLMLEMNRLRARLLMLVPPIYRRDVTEIGQSINLLLGRYVRGQIIVCSLFGVLCTISFSILGRVYGMGYPMILGLMAACIYIVPYLGMTTVAVSAGLTAYFTASSPVACTAFAVGSVIFFNLIVDYGITPRIVGQGVGLHPLMVIFALLSGFQLGGIPGMVLAVPFFASLRVILIYLFPQLAAPISMMPPESQPPSGKTLEQAAREVVSETRAAEVMAENTVDADNAAKVAAAR